MQVELVSDPTEKQRFIFSGDESTKESCSICLMRLKSQQMGTPNCCAHLFCAECIIEWSQNVATCPIDRMKMKSIKIIKDGKEVGEKC